MLVAGVTLSLTVFFPIDSITAGGSKIYESSSIIEASGLSLGKNLFTFSNRELTENIRKTLPYIKTVTVKRKLPGSVSIKVTDAMEFACYKADDLYYTVGEDGFVLRQSDTQAENIMLVETNNVVECKPGSYIKFDKPTVEETVSGMISEFSQNGVSVDIINVEDE
ncbi:MAG: FtsQ-type POTRA domain-containing protein, partial [Clostridia bacterium]|nr:FtsQ-type POTRA domain-containing protein [Clostridia bacterium]